MWAGISQVGDIDLVPSGLRTTGKTGAVWESRGRYLEVFLQADIFQMVVAYGGQMDLFDN
jgi:hypothetical protein